MNKFIKKERILINFIAKGENQDEWKIVLVENGPWDNDIEDKMFSLQDKIYDCIDIVIDGKLAKKFPLTNGKLIIIQVDFYNIENQRLNEFLGNFSNNVFRVEPYKSALNSSKFVSNIKFEFNFDYIM